MLRHQLFRFIVALGIGVAASGAASATSLTGTVQDAVTGLPLGGAHVSVHVLPESVAVWTFSAPDGSYAIDDIPGGNTLYAVTCQLAGYSHFYGRLDELAHTSLTLQLRLEPAPAPGPDPPPPPDSSFVTGTVNRLDGGGALQPVAGATVRLTASLLEYDAITDAEGQFLMRLVSGAYSVRVTAPGYESLLDYGLVLDSGGLTLMALLSPSPTGVDPDVPGAGIELRTPFPNPSRGMTTLAYALEKPGVVELTLYDLGGRAVRVLESGWRAAGERRLTFSTAGLPSGTYFCRLRFGGRTISRALNVVR